MRSRKSPIVLVTILAVMACIAFGINYTGSKSAGGPEAPPPPPPSSEVKAVGAPRPAENKQSVAETIKGSMNSGAAEPGGPASAQKPGMPGMPGGGPMILNPAHPTGKAAKPQINESSTSAQWYEKDSALGSKN